MRAYIYCTKAKPYLMKPIDENDNYSLSAFFPKFLDTQQLNGKIVANFELNTIEQIPFNDAKIIDNFFSNKNFESDYWVNEEILNKTCLSRKEINNYGKSRALFAWHIDDLDILDKPMELSEFASAEIKSELKKPCMNNFENPFLNALTTSFERIWEDNIITKAPQSWCYSYDSQGNRCIIISIKPEWVEKILNGEKTIEIRKTYPKEVGLSE